MHKLQTTSDPTSVDALMAATSALQPAQAATASGASWTAAAAAMMSFGQIGGHSSEVRAYRRQPEGNGYHARAQQPGFWAAFRRQTRDLGQRVLAHQDEATLATAA